MHLVDLHEITSTWQIGGMQTDQVSDRIRIDLTVKVMSFNREDIAYLISEIKQRVEEIEEEWESARTENPA